MSDQAEGLRELMAREMAVWPDGSVEIVLGTDIYQDAYYWADSKAHPGVWSLLRKITDRQTWGQPWKNIDTGKRMTWTEISQRFSRLVKVEEPK